MHLLNDYTGNGRRSSTVQSPDGDVVCGVRQDQFERWIFSVETVLIDGFPRYFPHCHIVVSHSLTVCILEEKIITLDKKSLRAQDSRHIEAEMASLLSAAPWPIPLRRDLLSQAGGTIWHPQPELWNLVVWPLGGSRQAFPTTT